MQSDHPISQQQICDRGCGAGQRALQFERSIEINSCIKPQTFISSTYNQQSNTHNQSYEI